MVALQIADPPGGRPDRRVKAEGSRLGFDHPFDQRIANAVCRRWTTTPFTIPQTQLECKSLAVAESVHPVVDGLSRHAPLRRNLWHRFVVGEPEPSRGALQQTSFLSLRYELLQAQALLALEHQFSHRSHRQAL